MSRIVNIHAAKTHLSRLVDAAGDGEEIVIARGGKPVARLVALAKTERKIRFGLLARKIDAQPGWDAPLTPAELARWHATPVEPARRRRRR